MALEQIILIIILVLIAIFIWAVFKKVFKLLFYVGVILLLLITANIYFIYKDVADLKENFAISTKKVILVDNDKVITGFLLDGEVNFLTNEQISDFSSHLEDNAYEEILGESYKLMVFDLKILNDLDVEEIETEEGTITKEEAIAFLKSNADAGEKAALFGVILAEDILSSRNPLFFFSEFKKGNIVVYPETALFKTVKFIPVSFIKNTAKNIFEKTKEKAQTFILEEGK